MRSSFLQVVSILLTAMAALFCLNCSKKTPETLTTSNEARANNAVDPESGLRADKLAAHPDDPSKPEGIAGVSDDQLAASEHLDDTATACIEAIQKNPDEPRYRFELGRILLLGGLKKEGREQLESAAGMGHAAACFYLAVVTDDAAMAQQLFEKASAGGFKPARDTLNEAASVNPEQQPAQNSDQSEPAKAVCEQRVCRLEWHALGLIADIPIESRDSVATEVEAIMNSDQQVLYCSCSDDKGAHAYTFWFEKTPPDLRKVIERVPNHPLLALGYSAISKPPATAEEAAEFAKKSQTPPKS